MVSRYFAGKRARLPTNGLYLTTITLCLLLLAGTRCAWAQDIGRVIQHFISEAQRSAENGPVLGALDRRQREQVQEWLVWVANYPGPLDGDFGPATRSAIELFQEEEGFGPSGVLSRSQLEILRDLAGQEMRSAGFGPSRNPSADGFILANKLFDKTEEGALGLVLSSSRTDAIFALRHFRDEMSLRELELELRNTDLAESITYTLNNSATLVVAGEQSGKKFYARFLRQQSGLIGFYSIYPADEPLFEKSIIATSLLMGVGRNSPPMTRVEPVGFRKVLHEIADTVRATGALVLNSPLNAETDKGAAESVGQPDIAKKESLGFWKFEDSIVEIEAEGTARTIKVERPGSSEEWRTTRRGTLFFKGNKEGGEYSGQAFVFSARCGPKPYFVSGLVSEDLRTVAFRGRAPIGFDGSCVGIRFAEREFKLVFVHQDAQEAEAAVPYHTRVSIPRSVTPGEGRREIKAADAPVSIRTATRPTVAADTGTHGKNAELIANLPSQPAQVQATAQQTNQRDSEAFQQNVLIAIVAIGGAIYLLPSIIGFYKGHANRWVILAMNVFGGLTLYGWVLALIWATKRVHRSHIPGGSDGGESGLNIYVNDETRVRVTEDRSVADQLLTLASLKESGALSPEEFDAAKKRILAVGDPS